MRKKINNIYVKWILSLVFFFINIQTFALVGQDTILPDMSTTAIKTNSIDWLFTFVKDTMFSLLWVVVVGVFIFMWARLLMARWKPEEFKAALMHLVYSVVWLFVISIAYLAVQLVSSLSLN